MAGQVQQQAVDLVLLLEAPMDTGQHHARRHKQSTVSLCGSEEAELVLSKTTKNCSQARIWELQQGECTAVASPATTVRKEAADRKEPAPSVGPGQYIKRAIPTAAVIGMFWQTKVAVQL